MAAVQSLYRYPIKGLNGERLPSALLRAGQGIAEDRAFAIAHGKTDFDPEAPIHLGKMKFLTLMTHPRLAELRVECGEENNGLTAVFHRDKQVLKVSLGDDDGVSSFNEFLDDFIGSEAKGTPKLVTAGGHMFSDIREDCVSVINISSVQAVGDALNMELDPLRFRANLYLEGLPAWQERDWQQGDELDIGSCRLRVMRHIVRCAATNVDLETARTDHDIPAVLRRSFERDHMGVYAEVIAGGPVVPGDRVLWRRPS